MSKLNAKFFSRKAKATAVFMKRLQSLPPDEQEAFCSHRHPCQDKHHAGLMAARSCAQLLQAEIGHFNEIKLVEPAADCNGWLIEVAIKSDVHPEWQPGFRPVYRGFKVYRRTENENSTK